MKVICDIEANGLEPTEIHLILCKNVETGNVCSFKELAAPSSMADFAKFAEGISLWIGHNFIGYDAPALRRLCGVDIPLCDILDTLVVSRLLDAGRDGGHSLESFGERFNCAKQGTEITDWSTLTPAMEARCRSDVEINFLVYKSFYKFIVSPRWASAIKTEHFIANFCQELKENGFAFDLPKAYLLLKDIQRELKGLDKELKESFLPKVSYVSSVSPKLTKHGTLNRSDFRWVKNGDLSEFQADAPFSRIEYVEFNPGSPKQIVERLNEAGWRPTEKTKGHKEAEKAEQR